MRAKEKHKKINKKRERIIITDNQHCFHSNVSAFSHKKYVLDDGNLFIITL